MRLKEGFILAELDGEYVAVPAQHGDDNFQGIVRLNESGKDIWQALEEGLEDGEIADRLVSMYEDLDRERAVSAVLSVVAKLREEGLLAD